MVIRAHSTRRTSSGKKLLLRKWPSHNDSQIKTGIHSGPHLQLGDYYRLGCPGDVASSGGNGDLSDH